MTRCVPVNNKQTSKQCCCSTLQPFSAEYVLYTHAHTHTIFVIVREVDLITEQNHPLAQLHGSHHNAIGCATVLTIVVKGLQQQLWSCCTREVEANHLKMCEGEVRWKRRRNSRKQGETGETVGGSRKQGRQGRQ